MALTHSIVSQRFFINNSHLIYYANPPFKYISCKISIIIVTALSNVLLSINDNSCITITP